MDLMTCSFIIKLIETGLLSHQFKLRKVTVGAGERGHKGAQVRCAGKQVGYLLLHSYSYKVIKHIIITRKTIDKDSR